MKNLTNKIAAAATITFMLLIGAITAMPFVSAAKITIRPADAGLSFSYDPIGINQICRMNLKFSAPAPFVGYVTDDVLPGAYVNYTKPDGTILAFQNLDEITYRWSSGDGSGTSYSNTWELAPDQTGEWIVTFYWPGDTNFNPYTVSNIFHVQQQQITIQRTSFGYLYFRPNPIGVNQNLLVEAWVTPRPLCVGEVFFNYQFTLTKPDGTTASIGPVTSFPEGSTWFEYTVDQVGNWTVRFTWPGDIYNTPVDVSLPLTVQEEPIAQWPAAPLPTQGPLTYPINPENRDWYTISGPWFHAWGDTQRTSYNLYSKAPRSSHILYRIPPYAGLGGIIGGDYGTGVYYDVDRIPFGSGTGGSIIGPYGYWTGDGNIHAFDMQTGEEVWSVPGAFDFGCIEGNLPELVRTTGSHLIKYDGLTGEKIVDIPGIIGSRYRNFDTSTVDVLNGYVIDIQRTGASVEEYQYFVVKWSYLGSDTNFTNRIAWNVSLPFTGPDPSNLRGATIDLKIPGGVISWITYPAYGDCGALNYTTGETLWARPLYNIQARNAHGVYEGLLIYPSDDRTVRALDLITGQEVWKSEETDYPWGADFAYSNAAAYDMIYKNTYAGTYAFNVSNGDIIWHFTTGESGFETPYGTWPTYDNIVGADGVLYVTTTEHSPTQPYYRGQHLFCVDAFTGEEIWRIMGTIAPAAIADGVLLASSTYDGYLYAFGQGPTETTVSTSSEVMTLGDSMLLKGTVLDMAPALKGLAAVSVDTMSAWEEYQFMQQPYPVTGTGVSVSLDALDPNNNYVHLGDATTDLTGQYSFAWTPDIAGKYTIVASFAGSDAYYGSTMEIPVLIAEGPAATAEPTPTPAPLTDTYILSIGVAAIIAIIVVGIIIILMLRKR